MASPIDIPGVTQINSTADKGPFQILVRPPVPKTLYKQTYYGPLRMENNYPPPVPDAIPVQEIAQYKKHSHSKLKSEQAIYTQIRPKQLTKRQKAVIAEIFGRR
jgi:hypothetical protein